MPAVNFRQLKFSDEEFAEFRRSIPEDEKLLTREQAIHVVPVSLRTLDAWAANARKAETSRDGKVVRKRRKGTPAPSRKALPHIRIGHNVFFRLGDLKRFMRENEIAA